MKSPIVSATCTGEGYARTAPVAVAGSLCTHGLSWDVVPHRVLCVSASMGAGHDGAAREMVRRLQEAGHDVELRDFLDSAPFKLGAALKGVYEFLIRYVPWSYEATYRVWFVLPFLCPPLALIISW